MKKISSVFSVLLIIAATFNFSIATHYCGGKIAQVNFSFGRAHASCGMENGTKSCSGKETLRKKCCDDQIFQNHTLGDYTAAERNSCSDLISKDLYTSGFIASIFQPALPQKIFYYGSSPPGENFHSLSFIRSFRI